MPSFKEANLQEANFKRADLKRANLAGADLYKVINLSKEQTIETDKWEKAYYGDDLKKIIQSETRLLLKDPKGFKFVGKKFQIASIVISFHIHCLSSLMEKTIAEADIPELMSIVAKVLPYCA